MGLSDWIIAIVSLIAGALVSIWISRHYFKRSVDKALTPYAHYFSSLFEGVDPSVRESLKVAYKDTAVEDLLDVQFLIANTGQRAIRDVISPLALKMPDGCVLLDASILHVSPEAREVKVEQTDSLATFGFPLLNSGEFFITKLLVKGRAKLGDFEFAITADDLPPILKCQRLPPEAVEDGEPRKFEKGMLIAGCGVVLAGAAVSLLALLGFDSVREIWLRGPADADASTWISAVASLIAAIPAILLVVLGSVLCGAAFGNFSFPKQRRFQVPTKLHRAGLRLSELRKLDERA